MYPRALCSIFPRFEETFEAHLFGVKGSGPFLGRQARPDLRSFNYALLDGVTDKKHRLTIAINNTLSIFKCFGCILSNKDGDFMIIKDTQIIDEVCRLRLQGLTITKIAHAVSRDNPNFFKKYRKEKNVSSSDILQIIAELKREGRLPTTLLDSLKQKIGEKGRAKPEGKKAKRKRLPKAKPIGPPPRFF